MQNAATLAALFAKSTGLTMNDGAKSGKKKMAHSLTWQLLGDGRKFYRYVVTSEDYIFANGSIALKRNASGSGWTIDNMQMTPTGKGYGSTFLTMVIKMEDGLVPSKAKVKALTQRSMRFFQKHGFSAR